MKIDWHPAHAVLGLAMAMTACAPAGFSMKHAAMGDKNERQAAMLVSPLPASKAVKGGAQFAEQQAAAQIKPEVFKRSDQMWIGARNRPVKAEERLPAIFYEPFVLSQADGDLGVNIDQLGDRLAEITRISVRIMPEVHEALAMTSRLMLEESMEFVDDPDAVDLDAIAPEISGKDEEKRKAAAANATAVRTGAPRLRTNMGRGVQPPLPLPPHLLKWKGNLRGFLNHLTDRLNLYWTFEDNTIVIARFATEVFELASAPGESKYRLDSEARGGSARRGGATGGSASGGGAQAAGSVSGSLNLEIKEEGDLNYHKDAVAVVKKLVSTVPGSEVLLANGSGRLVVKSSRPILNQVRSFLQSENASLLKQVLIQMDIYTLSSDTDRQFGVDWTLVYERLLGRGTLSTASVGTLTEEKSGRLGFLLNDGGRLSDSRLVVNSLSLLGYTAQHRPVTMMAMNRQWVRKSRLSTQSYLAETTPAVSTSTNALGVGLPGLTPGSVTVGDQIAVMPQVLENNTVVLKFGLNFSDLLRLDTVSSGEGTTRQQVQVPSTAMLSDQFTVALKPGEVFAITGLSRDSRRSDQATLAENLSVWAGGSQRQSSNREHFLVLLRVVLL